MNKIKEKNLYEQQKELIDIANQILKEGFKNYIKDERYEYLFYKKSIPPHIKQVLDTTRNKIAFKPIFSKIKGSLNISQHYSKKLVENYGFGYVLQNLNRIKELQKKYDFEYIFKNLDNLLK